LGLSSFLINHILRFINLFSSKLSLRLLLRSVQLNILEDTPTLSDRELSPILVENI